MRHTNNAHYVKAFTGIYCSDGIENQLDNPLGQPETGEEVSRRQYRSGAVRTIGTRSATQAFQIDAGEVCIKGRPFSLTRRKEAVRLDPARIGAQCADLDGRFSMCAFFPDSLVLATDLLGASGLFYHIDAKSRLLFSTHLGLLLKALPKPPELDDRGVAAMLAGSCSVGGRTPYRGIYRLEPGQFLCVRNDNGAIFHKIYTYLEVSAALAEPYPIDGDPRSTLERLLRESLAREMHHEKVGVMLSGGKDSQALAQSLLLSGADGFPTVTFGEWRSRDVRGARRFTAQTGLPHRVVSYRGWSFASYAPLILSLGGGMYGFELAHSLGGYARAEKAMSLGLVGYLGEVLSGVHVQADYQPIPDLAFSLRRCWGPAFNDAYGENLAELIAEVNALADSYHGLSLLQRGMMIDLVIRQGTWISSHFDPRDWLLPLAFPLYSRNLMRFFFNLPMELLQDQNLYSQWLQASYPRCTRGNRFALRWSMYEGAQQVLDRVFWRTGRFRMQPLMDWDSRIGAEKKWLKTLLSRIDDAKLRHVCEGQNFEEWEGKALLRGVALGVAASQHRDVEQCMC